MEFSEDSHRSHNSHNSNYDQDENHDEQEESDKSSPKSGSNSSIPFENDEIQREDSRHEGRQYEQSKHDDQVMNEDGVNHEKDHSHNDAIEDSACVKNLFYKQNLFDYNSIAINVNNRMLTGSCEGKSFLILKPNSKISYIQVLYNNLVITKVKILFEGDNKYFYTQGNSTDQNPSFQEFYFGFGETLINYMIIGPTKDNEHISYIYFETNYGKKFEAGTIQIDQEQHKYDVNGKFLAGIFGYSEDHIKGLGIILQSIDSCNKHFTLSKNLYYSIIANNKKDEILTGSCGEKAFQIQVENDSIKRITAYYNDEIINGISIVYFDDNEKEYLFGDKDNHSDQNSQFEFIPSEYVVYFKMAQYDGDEKGIAYIAFETNYGSSFYAGVKDGIIQQRAVEYNIKKNFLAGIFGYTNNDKLVGLGLIVYKDIVKEELENIEYYVPDDIRANIFKNSFQKHKFSSLKYCNEQVKKNSAIANIEKKHGSMRIIDGPILFKTILLKKQILVPKIQYGVIHGEFNYKFEYELVDWSQINMDAIQTIKESFEVELDPCQCVTVESKWNSLRIDHIQVKAHNKFFVKVNMMIQNADNDEYYKGELAEITREITGEMQIEDIFFQSINYNYDKVKCHKYTSKIGLKKQPECCKLKY